MSKKAIIITIIITLLILSIYEVVNKMYGKKLKAVVVKVDQECLLIMGIDDYKSLYRITNKNGKFKKGQEIVIYFDGIVMTSYPAQLGGVAKVKVIKEQSDIKIPDDVLRYAYNSYNNVNVEISEFTTSGIYLRITDKNEIPYKYAKSYKINRKVKNENYTGIGQKIGEDTENSTAGYTRNWFRIFLERG